MERGVFLRGMTVRGKLKADETLKDYREDSGVTLPANQRKNHMHTPTDRREFLKSGLLKTSATVAMSALGPIAAAIEPIVPQWLAKV